MFDEDTGFKELVMANVGVWAWAKTWQIDRLNDGYVWIWERVDDLGFIWTMRMHSAIRHSNFKPSL